MGNADAAQAAQEAVSWVWEECKFGRLSADTGPEFWALVSERLYKQRNAGRFAGRFVSMDAEIPNTEGGLDRHSSGFNGYVRQRQEDYVYYMEILGGIGLLPEKHKEILSRLANGESALDISNDLRLPIHTVFARMRDARAFLNRQDLIGIAVDKMNSSGQS